LPLADIRKVADAAGDNAIVVVDEAYVDFSNKGSAVELVNEYNNVCVMQTLSKVNIMLWFEEKLLFDNNFARYFPPDIHPVSKTIHYLYAHTTGIWSCCDSMWLFSWSAGCCTVNEQY
jgi:hypothetical protein